MTSIEPIRWSDSLATGVDEIDRQHRILIDTLNEVEAKHAGRMDARSFERITRDLLAYAIYHFETEEQLIKRYGYDLAQPEDTAVHQQQHRNFSATVISLRAKALDGNAAVQEELLAFLKNWLLNHICTTDQRLGLHICAQAATKAE